MHETFPIERDFAWQEGYAAFSVSRSNVPQVADYIARQEAHHRTRTFEEEYQALLMRHEIAFDPARVLD